jgi:hypothetical protein
MLYYSWQKFAYRCQDLLSISPDNEQKVRNLIFSSDSSSSDSESSSSFDGDVIKEEEEQDSKTDDSKENYISTFKRNVRSPFRLNPLVNNIEDESDRSHDISLLSREVFAVESKMDSLNSPAGKSKGFSSITSLEGY